MTIQQINGSSETKDYNVAGNDILFMFQNVSRNCLGLISQKLQARASLVLVNRWTCISLETLSMLSPRKAIVHQIQWDMTALSFAMYQVKLGTSSP